MQFHGNSSDPLAKTLRELAESEVSSQLGDAGDFFKPVHDRDTHVKPKNRKDEEFEFNAALLQIDSSSVMLKYIVLKNYIVDGTCAILDETHSVDKEDGAITVFVKWLQPKGLFLLGTVERGIPSSASNTDKKESTTENLVDDTNPPKKYKGKGSRKKNAKIKL